VTYLAYLCLLLLLGLLLRKLDEMVIRGKLDETESFDDQHTLSTYTLLGKAG